MLATHPLAWVAGDYCLAVATQLPHERWNDRIGAPPDHTPALRCEHSGFFDFRSPLLLYCQGLRLRAIVLRQQLLGCCSSAAAAVRCLLAGRPPAPGGWLEEVLPPQQPGFRPARQQATHAAQQQAEQTIFTV
jgi:hypothetical protein